VRRNICGNKLQRFKTVGWGNHVINAKGPPVATWSSYDDRRSVVLTARR